MHDPSVNADQRALEVLDQNIRRKFPGKTIADYINELKAQRGATEDDDDDDERQYLRSRDRQPPSHHSSDPRLMEDSARQILTPE